MKDLNSDIMALIGQAVILVRGGIVYDMNASAAAIFGGDCKGKNLSEVLNVDIAGSQASNFTASISLKGKNYIARVSKKTAMQIVVLSEVTEDEKLMNDTFLSTMRSSIMLMSMSTAVCRRKADENGYDDLSTPLAVLTRNIAISNRQISNISTVKNIMNGTLAFSPKYINIARFCQEYTEILRELIPNLKTELDMPEECIVLADPVLLQQLLLNLTSNSLLHGKTDSISLRLIDGGRNLILAFSDSGCGIESDRLGTVFERYRVRKELTDVRVGAGLGLTVVRGIAEKHGGTLLLESRENQGTAIRVSLQKNSDGAKLYDTDKGSINMKEIITGLAECLPTEYFTEKYLD